MLTAIPAAIRADERPPGCLVVNATGELVPRDPDTTRRAREIHPHRRCADCALETARSTGELRADLDPAAAALLVNTVTQGLQVAEADPDRPRIQATIDLALAALALQPTPTTA